MGRPRKNATQATTVTLTLPEIQGLVQRLGYKDQQSLIDDLAMGVIPPTANSEATTSVTPVAVGAEKSAEVACSRLETEIRKQPKVTWADVVEVDEAQKELETTEPEGKMGEIGIEGGEQSGIEAGLSWLDVVKGNRTYEKGQNLEYYPAGMEVELSDEDWMEGEKMWKYTLAANFGRNRPTYDKVRKWTVVNWKMLSQV